MANNLSCIGLPVTSLEELQSITESVIPYAVRIRVKGGFYLHATDKSGAELWIQLDSRNEIIGINPHFSGKARSTVGITANVDRSISSPLDGAYHAWANPNEDDTSSGDYPFVFDVPDFYSVDHPKLPYRTEIQIAAFGQEAKYYESPEAYDKAQKNEPKFASESFIPLGLFSSNEDPTTPPTAHALLAGIVLTAEERVNSWTNTKFYYCHVRSLSCEFDLVLNPSELGNLPAVGGVLAGTFWLSGRLIDIPKRQKGFIERIFRR